VESKIISLQDLITKVKNRSNISQAGMILCHNGIVRDCDRSGEKCVTGLKVNVNRSAIEEIRSWAESQKGIVAAEIHAFEGEFQIGDDLLYVVIAGDVRENVFTTMRETVERIKASGVQKTEHYK
jgi:molybdopterin synthase catalytic subunit